MVPIRKMPSKTFVLALCLASLLLGLSSPAMASGKPSVEATRVLERAEILFGQKDYSGAINEAKRFLFLHLDHPQAQKAKELIESANKAGLENRGPNTGQPEEIPVSRNKSVVVDLIKFYQKHMRSYKVSTCPSYPSCSEYGLQAIRKHGSVMGTFMFIDRFFREFTTVGTPPQVRRQGRSLHYDPLEENDYWLSREKEKL